MAVSRTAPFTRTHRWYAKDEMDQKWGIGRRSASLTVVALSLLLVTTPAVLRAAADAEDSAANALRKTLAQADDTRDAKAYAKAEAAAREWLKRDATSVDALVLLGHSLLGQERCADAIETAEQALAIKSNLPAALGLRADALIELGDLKRARADCEALVAAKSDLHALARMGRLQFAEGDAAPAIERLEAAVAAGERDEASPADRAQALVQLGELRFRTGDWDDAQAHYEAALALREDDVDVHDHLAELFAARGDFEKAIAHSDRAMARAPCPEFHEGRGDIYAAMKEYEKAHASYEQAHAGYIARAASGRAGDFVRLARMHCDVASMRDPVDAARWGRRAVQARRTAATYDALAWAQYNAGSVKDAVETIERALRERTADADVLYHAGLIYSRDGDNRKGAMYLRRAALANPKFNEFHFRR